MGYSEYHLKSGDWLQSPSGGGPSSNLTHVWLYPASISESHLLEEMVVGDRRQCWPMEPMPKMPARRRCEAEGVPRHHRSALALSAYLGEAKAAKQIFSQAPGRGAGHRHPKCRWMDLSRFLGTRRNLDHLWLKGIAHNLKKLLVLQGPTGLPEEPAKLVKQADRIVGLFCSHLAGLTASTPS